MIGLLPYLDQTALWETISSPQTYTNSSGTAVNYPPFGTSVTSLVYQPWSVQISSLLCPSDGATVVDVADTNYAFCWGDNGNGNMRPQIEVDSNSNPVKRNGKDIKNPAVSCRGVFARDLCYGIRDMKDGSTTTIAVGEVARFDNSLIFNGLVADAVGSDIFESPTANCLQRVEDPAKPGYYKDDLRFHWSSGNTGVAQTNESHRRGGKWTDNPTTTGFNTVFPPNGPSCLWNSHTSWGSILNSGSHHTGGAQFVMAEGSVQFISETINTGSLATADSLSNKFTGESPFGVWGALGSRNGGEVVDGDAF